MLLLIVMTLFVVSPDNDLMKALSDLKMSVANINLEICQKKCKLFVGFDSEDAKLFLFEYPQMG